MIKYPLKKKNWLQALIKLKLRFSCKKPQATPSKIVLKENKMKPNLVSCRDNFNTRDG
jgi:hypothetical protein